VTDPKLTIIGLLKSGWSLSYTPHFSSDWYDGKAGPPQVTVTHVMTTSSFIAFSEDLPNAERRIRGVYQVDVWSLDAEKRWEMLQEVDRIMKSVVDSPGGGLEFIEVRSWRDIDEVSVKPPIYRCQLQIEVYYYG
jgi:hypothetical protein